MPTTTAADPALTALVEDLRLATHLLDLEDPWRGHLALLTALPASAEAWIEVLTAWEIEAGHGLAPDMDDRARAALLGAAGVAALRASRQTDTGPLASALLAAARWCFFCVRCDAH